MARLKETFSISLWSALFMIVGLDALAADKADKACPRADRLQIQDLDMSPDPVGEGQRIRAWKVRLRFDGPHACETEIFVREGTNIVGHEQRYNLRPGIHEIEIRAAQSFRLQAREHCFNVMVDFAGSHRQSDTARRFCVKQQSIWSFREPGDRDWRPR